MRIISTPLLCSTLLTLLLTACSSDDHSSPAETSNNELNPTSTQLDLPPTGSSLPADLTPPN